MRHHAHAVDALIVALVSGCVGSGCVGESGTWVLRAGDGEHAFDAPPGEHVVCFGFEADDPSLRAAGFAASVDDRIVHHASLLRAPRLPTGHDCASIGVATPLYVWSPGDGPFRAPAGTALSLVEPGGVLVLEVHYVNGTGASVADRSGIVVDLTPGAEVEMGMWITGDPVLAIPPHAQSHVEERRCEIRSTEPVTLHAVSPHMHEHGVAMSVVLLHAGAETVLLDVDPFDPSAQRTVVLATPVTLSPGDLVTTRCVYDNPSDETIRYGTTLDDEMCFAYFWASPIELLREDASFCH